MESDKLMVGTETKCALKSISGSKEKGNSVVI